jgi:hypothetical protein
MVVLSKTQKPPLYETASVEYLDASGILANDVFTNEIRPHTIFDTTPIAIPQS